MHGTGAVLWQVPATLEFILEIKADRLPSFQSLNIQIFLVIQMITQPVLIGPDTNDLIAVDPKMIFEALNRCVATSCVREQIKYLGYRPSNRIYQTSRRCRTYITLITPKSDGRRCSMYLFISKSTPRFDQNWSLSTFINKTPTILARWDIINVHRNDFDSLFLAVTAALDKTDNEHIAKELTRIIYTLTSKESSQGRGWCSLICNCDGLRILIKMLDATVEFVVTLSGNFG